MKIRKKAVVAHLANIVFFVCSWVLLYFEVIASGGIKTVSAFRAGFLLNTSSAYLNSMNFIGTAMPILFVLTSARILAVDDPYFLLRLKRDGYVKYKAKKMVLTSLLFTLEYTIVHIIFCLIFCKLSVLGEVRFFQSVILLYISVAEFFFIVGACMQFLQYLLKLNNSYMVFSILLFVFLTGVSVFFRKEMSPAFFCTFIDEYTESGIFDWFTFIINAVKTVAVCYIFSLLNRLLFTKQDIIISEKIDIDD